MKKFEFPSYLLYGLLDVSSIRQEQGFHFAEYTILGKQVLRIKVRPGYASLCKLIDGAEMGHVEHMTLEKAMLVFLKSFCFSKDQLCREIITNLEILGFRHIEREICNDSIYYYPGGCLYKFRIPVIEGYNLEQTITLTRDDDLRLFIDGFYETVIATNISYNPSPKEIMILELLVPMANIYDTAIRLKNLKIIDEECPFDIIYHDSIIGAEMINKKAFPMLKSGQDYLIEYK